MTGTREVAGDAAALARGQGNSAWFWRGVFTPFAGSRILLVVVAWLGLHLAPEPWKSRKWEVGRDAMLVPIGRQMSPAVHPFVNMWSRWDSEWYLSIAKNGYRFVPGEESNVAFFPLYPFAVRLLHALGPWTSDASWLLTGILLSNAALLLALSYLYQLVRLDYGEANAARAVLYLCVFPTTLFLSAFYSEALFLGFVLSSFYYVRRHRWILAGLLAAPAALGRPPGVLLVLGLAFEYLQQRQFEWRKVRPDILALALAPLVLLAHFAYFKWRFGAWDILSQAESIKSWSRHFTFPWMTVGGFFFRPRSGSGGDTYLDLVFTLGLIGLTSVAAIHLRPSQAFYGVVTLLFITSWGSLNSVSRFGVVMFPVMIALALLGSNKLWHWGYLLGSTTIAACSMYAFSHWGWVG